MTKGLHKSGRLGDPAGLLAGLLFIVIGLASVILAVGWRVGTAAQMGPGYFPLVLGGLLVVLGISIGARAYAAGERKALPSVDLRAALPIICPIVLFSLVVSSAGLLLSVIGLVLLTRLADRTTGWIETLALAIFLAALVAMIFVVGLGIRLPLLPAFVAGWFA